jgi:hypothetical protein
MKKHEINYLKSKYPKHGIDLEKTNNMDLMNLLTESHWKFSTLYSRIILENNRKPEEKIKDMMVSESTKYNYLQEWKKFSKWLNRNNKTLSKDSANEYLGTFTKLAASTQRTKYITLQVLLQHLIDPSLRLNKFRMRISYLPKRALTDEEIRLYLEEQKNIDFEDYVIQRLLILYGLRINTIALLKIKDLEFLDAHPGEDHEIHLPDSKVKNRRLEKIPSDLEKELIDYLGEDDRDPEEYVFYSSGRDYSFRRRAQYLGLRINNRIKNSKVLVHRKGYKYSSHMFRKTKAYNMFNSEVNKLKEKVRAAIGQSQGSQAIESYIN